MAGVGSRGNCSGDAFVGLDVGNWPPAGLKWGGFGVIEGFSLRVKTCNSLKSRNRNL